MSKKVLYISQEIKPYVPDNEISKTARELLQKTQELGDEVRVFMPCFGKINERRYQLHNVVRLFGLKVIIGEYAYPINIKVTSIPGVRMQIYFINSDEYFERKSLFRDAKGNFYKDNDERLIFFSRATLETVKQLSWEPDIIHCHGWFTSLIPYYIKNMYLNDSNYKKAKIVTSVYDSDFKETLDPKFYDKILGQDSPKETLSNYDPKPSYNTLINIAADYSDGIIQGSEKISEATTKVITNSKTSLLKYQGAEDYAQAYNTFYDSLL